MTTPRPEPAALSWRLAAEELGQHGAAVALTGAAAPLTYRDLAARAAAAASALEAAGLRAGDRIALLSGGRAHDEAVGLAAILLLGGVAVPLDAGSPPLRLAEICAARGVRALVHDSRCRPPLVSALGAIGLARVVLDEVGVLVGSSGTAPPPPAGADDRRSACILHTSGSTGTPKPVPLSWAGLDAFTAWMIDLLGLTAGDRVCRSAELIFDLAWFDHLATWRAGATLCTLPRRQLATGQSLLRGFQELRPTVSYAVPSLYMKLEAALPPGERLDPGLRVLCFAGEVFPPRELLALAERAPQARLLNLFGPTETNVCTFHEVDRSRLEPASELPIGRPCPYARCTLVGEDGAVIEGPGTGELVVEGPTALGGRVATGDRVERGADGLLYFRGRLDRMLKIHGYRVEPGEVEAALCSHPRVRQAAVVPRPHGRLGTVLHGFAELREGEPLPPRELRSFAARRLPPYLVPEQIDIVSALPRTATGKIDYRALGAAGSSAPGSPSGDAGGG